MYFGGVPHTRLSCSSVTLNPRVVGVVVLSLRGKLLQLRSSQRMIKDPSIKVVWQVWKAIACISRRSDEHEAYGRMYYVQVYGSTQDYITDSTAVYSALAASMIFTPQDALRISSELL